MEQINQMTSCVDSIVPHFVELSQVNRYIVFGDVNTTLEHMIEHFHSRQFDM